jgi:hypothetical protein
VDLVELRERANGIGNLPARESTEDIVSKLAELCLPGALVDHDATHMDVARTAKAQFLRARADTPDDLRDRNRLVVELADCLEQALVISRADAVTPCIVATQASRPCAGSEPTFTRKVALSHKVRRLH